MGVMNMNDAEDVLKMKNVGTVLKMLADRVDPWKINPALIEKALDECLDSNKGIEEIITMIVMSNHGLVIPPNKAEEILDILLRPLPIDYSQRKHNIRAAFHIIKSCKEIPLQRKEQVAGLMIGVSGYKMIIPGLFMMEREPTLEEKNAIAMSYLAFKKIYQAIRIARYGVSPEVFAAMKKYCESRNNLGVRLKQIEDIEMAKPIPWSPHEL